MDEHGLNSRERSVERFLMTQESKQANAYILFAIVTLVCALGSLTQTVMNSMLLGVQADLGTTEAVSQWLTTLYMLVIGITVPLVAHLSRKMSVKSLMVAALGLFIVGSVMDWLAPNFILLLAGRVPQAVATGITLPVLQTVAMTRFPPGKTGTAMGIAGVAMGFAPNIGPLIGGALVVSLGWRSFFIMLAIVLVMLLACTFALISREEAPNHDAHLDWISFLLSTIGFGGLLLGFTNAATLGLADPQVIIPLLLGAACIILFISRQMRIPNPLISMDVMGNRTYVISLVGQCALFASFMGITLIVPLFVQNVCGMSALDAGIVFIPATILAVVFNPIGGILSDKIGAGPVLVGGGLFLSVGAVTMIFVDASTPLWLLTLMQTIRGIGVSSMIGPFISWGMSRLPGPLMNDGSIFFTTLRQCCASFGTAIMMLLITGVAQLAFAGAEVLAYQLAFGFSALLSVAVLLIGLLALRMAK